MATAKKKATKKTTSKAGGKLTAAQRIEAIEKRLIANDKNSIMLAEDIDSLRNLVQALAKRLNATIQAGETEDGISSKSVKDIQIQENIKELEGRIDFLLDKGFIEKKDESETSENSFIVGRELDPDGTVSNPRVQFPIIQMPDKYRDALVGHKLGDVVSIEGDDAPSLEILEIYEIIQPDQRQDFSQENTDS